MKQNFHHFPGDGKWKQRKKTRNGESHIVMFEREVYRAIFLRMDSHYKMCEFV